MSLVMGTLSICFILVSVVAFVLGSMPTFQVQSETENGTNSTETEVRLEKGRPHRFLALTEIVCVSWFTVEYLLRFFAAVKKFEFVKREKLAAFETDKLLKKTKIYEAFVGFHADFPPPILRRAMVCNPL